MAQVFRPSADTLMRLALIGGGLAAAAVVLMGSVLYRSPVLTQVGINRQQPIPFSHQRHVAGNGMDCRYCHTSVEDSSFAGIPPTQTCMTCHSQVLPDAPLLQPVHESWKTGNPIEWTRLYDLPDFVYFDHSAHVNKGVGCTTCHAGIDNMALTNKTEPLNMSWCLECHRAPEKFVRPKDKVFDTNWVAPDNQLEQGRELVDEYGIKVGQLTNCSVCHR